LQKGGRQKHAQQKVRLHQPAKSHEKGNYSGDGRQEKQDKEKKSKKKRKKSDTSKGGGLTLKVSPVSRLHRRPAEGNFSKQQEPRQHYAK